MYTSFFKPIMDIALSIVAVLILSPIFLIIAVLIYLVDGQPIIYKSTRMGHLNKKFIMYKFRTFKNGTPERATDLIINPKDYLIKGGGLLRKSSLDEIPQLFNVFKGEMSLIGPRPSLPSQEKLNELRVINNIYELKPGITGLAQINGRDLHSDKEKIYFDKEYLEKISFLYDVKIILITLIRLFRTKSILH